MKKMERSLLSKCTFEIASIIICTHGLESLPKFMVCGLSMRIVALMDFVVN